MNRINEGVPQPERLVRLNRMAREQMRILLADIGVKQLEKG